jgi:hypothetical protein
MRRLATGLVVAMVVGLMGSSLAGASGKFGYVEVIQFPGGDLVVTFDEGGQKRFDAVGYRLDATASVMTCQDPDHCIAVLSTPSATVTGLTPDEKGRVTGTLTLAPNAGGGGICGCSSHVDYWDVTLTNLASGHVYRLDPISGDAP